MLRRAPPPQLSVSDAEVLKCFGAFDPEGTGCVAIFRIQQILGSDADAGEENVERRRERGAAAVRANNKYPTRRHPKPLEQEHAQHFQTVPTWDPVKLRLSTEGFIAGSPNKLSRSLTRGFASVSNVTMVRPSVAAERQRRTETEPTMARSMSQASMGSHLSMASTVHSRGPLSFLASKTDQVEHFVSRLHDAELVKQQLADKFLRLSALIDEAHESLASADDTTTYAKRVLAQVQINERRAHELATRANDVQTINKELRHEVTQLRDSRMSHLLELDDKATRINFLDKEVPKLLESTSHFLHEVDKYNSRKTTTAQEAKVLLGQQAKELSRVDQEIERIDSKMEEIENAQYGEEQLHRRKEYYEGKELRATEAAAKTKLGYLAWLSNWWKSEFDQLEHATSFTFDPSADGPDSASSSVKRVTGEILKLQQQNDSLVSYLQQVELEAKALESEHKQLVERKEALADRPPEDMSAETMVGEAGAVNDRSGALAGEMAALLAPTQAVLKLLKPLVDRTGSFPRDRLADSEAISEKLAKLQGRLAAAEETEEVGQPERKLVGLEESLDEAGQGVLDLLISTKQIVARRELLLLTRRPPFMSQESTAEVKAQEQPQEPAEHPAEAASPAGAGDEPVTAEASGVQVMEGPSAGDGTHAADETAGDATGGATLAVQVPEGVEEPSHDEITAESPDEQQAESFKLLSGWSEKAPIQSLPAHKTFRHLQMEEHKRKQEERLDEVVSRRHTGQGQQGSQRSGIGSQRSERDTP